MLNTPALQRVLLPKITPQAAARMYIQHVTGIATTTATLGFVWWGAYFDMFSRVMWPERPNAELCGGEAVRTSAGLGAGG